MTAFPQRKETRLRGFDYRSPGPYVLTICTHGREHRFGRISPDCEMHLNPAGQMVAEIWRAIPEQFPVVTMDAFVVMPNHVHGIVTLGMDRIEENPDLADIIGWFKAVSTNRYIWGVRDQDWPRFNGHVWQRDYYEHIVRDGAEMDRFRTYITNNPAMWATDRYALPL